MTEVVGPGSPASGEVAASGGLRVYSGRPSTAFGGDTVPAFENTVYEIRSDEGKLLETVPNVYGSRVGELPTFVKLTAGSYRIIAWSPQRGLVTVPVIISAGRTTAVRFDKIKQK